MTDQQDVLSLRLARYGVPAVILVFYLTAALRFSYTPESTFVALGQVVGLPSSPAGMFVSPLWTALLTSARTAGIDPLLAAKVLSLLFTSVVLLTTFLVAIEILRDRFLAFAVVLMVAVESWLTQAAVSGHPFALGMALLLGSVFFLQRNEYPVSAILAGLAALVFWQALFLFPLLAVDAIVNATEKDRRTERAARVVAAGLAVAALWPVIGVISGHGPLPWMPPLAELVAPSAPGLLVYAVCFLVLVAGVVVLLMKGEQGGRVVLALLPALGPLMILGACSLSANGELWRMALPLLFAATLFGVRLLLGQLGRLPLLYPIAFLLAGLTLLQNQTGTQNTVRDLMSTTGAQNRELAALAAWVRSHAGMEVRVFSDRPGILVYYSGREVRAGTESLAAKADLVVAARIPGPDFIAVYRLPSSPDAPEIPGAGYAVWRKE